MIDIIKARRRYSTAIILTTAHYICWHYRRRAVHIMRSLMAILPSRIGEAPALNIGLMRHQLDAIHSKLSATAYPGTIVS